jgi:hypothetical protein
VGIVPDRPVARNQESCLPPARELSVDLTVLIPATQSREPPCFQLFRNASMSLLTLFFCVMVRPCGAPG